MDGGMTASAATAVDMLPVVANELAGRGGDEGRVAYLDLDFELEAVWVGGHPGKRPPLPPPPIPAEPPASTPTTPPADAAPGQSANHRALVFESQRRERERARRRHPTPAWTRGSRRSSTHSRSSRSEREREREKRLTLTPRAHGAKADS